MRDKIAILEHKLADIEHLELSLLQALTEQNPARAEELPLQPNKRASDIKQRLLKRIAALKAGMKR